MRTPTSTNPPPVPPAAARSWAAPSGSVQTRSLGAPSTPPPLSPAYVKDTIAALTASRRSLGMRLDNLDLFGEPAARPDDPIEVQLLFAARDDYLGATLAGSRGLAMVNMSKLLAQARGACDSVATEMNRLFIAAMTSETSQKKINAMLKIADAKSPRKSTLTLSEMMEDVDALNPAPAPPADYNALGGTDESPEAAAEDDQVGCADEFQAQPGAGCVPAE